MSIIARAAVNPASDGEIQRYQENRLQVKTDGLLLDSEVDLTNIPQMTVGELVEQVETDVAAIDELEVHIFRHAVRVAACLQELMKRDRQKAEEAGEKFRKTRWVKWATQNYFGGRLGQSSMYVYERIARPDNQAKALEFQEKIEVVRAVRQEYAEEAEIYSALEEKGMPRAEVDLMPEQFSIRSFLGYLKHLENPESQTPQKQTPSREGVLQKKQKMLANKLQEAEVMFYTGKPVLEKANKEGLRELERMRRDLSGAIEAYRRKLEDILQP